MKRVGILLVMALVAVLPAGPVSAAGGTFSDDDASVHESDIETLAGAGITRGCGTDRYCPDDPVTRDQMAAFLVRALQLSPATGTDFTDDDTSVFEADIQTLAANGITSGCGTDRYCPDDPVTRGQMAAFLVRALRLSPATGTDFTDDDTSVFEPDIQTLAANGITRGCAPDRYCPDDPVTRAQMASFLVRAIGLDPLVPVSFAASDRAPTNPERGFYQSIDLMAENDLSWVTADGVSLVHAYVRLDDYRSQDIPADFLADLGEHLEVARDAGVKVIFRASYNFGIGEPDASLAWVLRHIEQLAPVWNANADVIAVVQAGFIGAWGEWHSSSNGLDTPANRAAVLDALLEAVPAERMVQLRYPGDLIEAYVTPIDASDAHDGSDRARTGHHNDCFVSSPTDVGTYFPESRTAEFKDYLEAQTGSTWAGGETCDADLDVARWDCATTLREMERFHFTYINQGYYQGAIDSWKSEGCHDEIFDRLGYLIRATGGAHSDAVDPGGSFTLDLNLVNDGFAAPMNPRSAYIVLDGPERVEVELADDPRDWQPGQISLRASVPVPAGTSPGDYRLSLWLPDPDLPGRSDYAIRLANDGIWESGANTIGTITVSGG
jgi:hypothetical protein